MKLGLTAMTLSLAVLAGCNTAGGSGQGVFISQDSLQVLPSPTNPADFEVLQKAPNGATDYWCAAGEYARRKLGVGSTDKVYLRKPSGPSEFRVGRSSVGYTVQPSPDVQQAGVAGGQRFTKSMSRVGENWGAESARSVCELRAPRGFN
ncbi:MAG: hypothetical protein ABJO67_18120 [Pseudoruegeria sp.]